MLPSFGLSAAFLLSGAAGLIFQVVWFYRCGLVFGSGVASATVVLSGFMGGLALGNALAGRFGTRITRLVRAYAVLEAVVAVTGLTVTYLLPHLGGVLVPLARATGDTGALVNLLRFLFAFVLMAVPTTAMGATLPLLVAASCEDGDRFAVALGRLYGWNTIGAVAGALVSEVVLIARVGISGSAWIAALLNVGAALLAISIAGRKVTSGARDAARDQSVVADLPATLTYSGPIPPEAGQPPPWLRRPTGAFAQVGGPPELERARVVSGRGDHRGAVDLQTPGPATRSSWPLYVATLLSGAILLALEVVWFRFLSMYVLVTTLAMSLMLVVVLAGIGGGGLFASVWLRRRESAAASLPAVACLSGLAAIGSYVGFQSATSGTQVGQWTSVLWFACVLTLPVSCLSGVLFTLVGDAVHRRQPSALRAAGRLTLANTIGAIAGPPLATYVLLPFAGMEHAFFTLALAYGVVALLTTRAPGFTASATRRPIHWRKRFIAAAVALLMALALFPFGAMAERYFPRAAAAYDADGSTIVATREGPSETLFVMQQAWMGQPVYSRLVTNGFSMSGTALQGQRYMRAFAYYPMLLHDGPLAHALVVCYGVGVTVGAVTHIPSVQTIDVAEISKDVIAMSDAIYPPDARPLSDPRVRVHVEDGRFFLQTTTTRYDLITGEPPPPRTPGTVNIYTRDYFQLVHDRLAQGGIATYWVPVARPNPGTDVNTIIRAFCDVFSDCSLWNATPFDLMLVGSRGLTGSRTMEQFTSPWQTPGLEARLREVGFERAEQIGATFVGDAAYLNDLTRNTPPLVDDFPQRLSPIAGRPSLSDPRYGVDPAATSMYQTALDVTRAREAFKTSPFIKSLWPPGLVERTVPFFDQQAVLNRVYWEGGRPLGQIDALDALLTTTTLRTLPLWVLGSDEVKQRIAESGVDASGGSEYARALRALSGRDYGGAAVWFQAAASRGMPGPTLRPLLAYALAKSGRVDLARALAARARPADDDERFFWGWLIKNMATPTS